MSGNKVNAPPVSKGDLVEVEIVDLSHDGEGIGHTVGFTLFVPETVPGDLAEARIISVQKTYARALPVSIIRSSSYRTEPRCNHFHQCGGCQLQHLKYPHQLRLKQKRVSDAIRRLGGLEAPVRPIVGMANPWSYRNKAQVPIAREGDRVVAGFYEKRSHRVVNIESCPIQHAGGNRVIDETRAALQALQIPVYDETNHRGLIRHILSRISFSTGEVLVTIITNGEKLPHTALLVERLCSRIENLVGIVQNINTRRGNVVLGNRNLTLWGRPYLVEKLGDLSFHVSPHSFFQVNPLQTGVLYDRVLAFAGLTGSETVFDLYCGAGAIALYLARKADRVVGVESVVQAVEDARANTSLNRIGNAEFYHGRAEEIVPDLLQKGVRADVIVVDPPRKGCDTELLKTISEAAPERIVYVSCNPATLARDLKILSADSYVTVEVQPVDMFPHTSHVECVVLMSRVEKQKGLKSP